MPTVPTAPIFLTRDDTLTNELQVKFTWNTPLSTGGAPI